MPPNDQYESSFQQQHQKNMFNQFAWCQYKMLEAAYHGSFKARTFQEDNAKNFSCSGASRYP